MSNFDDHFNELMNNPEFKAEYLKKSKRVAIGYRIKEARIAAGLSRIQAAGILDVSLKYVKAMELGYDRLEQIMVSKICQTYGISKEWLFGKYTEDDLPDNIKEMTKTLPPDDQKKLLRLLGMMGRATTGDNKK